MYTLVLTVPVNLTANERRFNNSVLYYAKKMLTFIKSCHELHILVSVPGTGSIYIERVLYSLPTLNTADFNSRFKSVEQ